MKYLIDKEEFLEEIHKVSGSDIPERVGILDLEQIKEILSKYLKDLPKKKKIGAVAHEVEREADERIGYNKCIFDCEETP